MPRMRSILVVLLVLAFPVLSGASPETEIRTLLPKDGIPAIDAPEYASVKDAKGFMQPDEMVIGINIKGEKRGLLGPFAEFARDRERRGGRERRLRYLVTAMLHGHRV